MNNIRIISSNDFDAATLTSTPSAAVNAPITNLQNGLRAKVSRMATVADPWVISAAWATARPISAVCLYKHNFTGTGTIRVQIYAEAAMVTELYNSGVLSLGNMVAWGTEQWGAFQWGGEGFSEWPASYYTLWFPAVAGAMGLKITINDSGNAAGFLEIGRVYTGAYWSPAVNISYGLQMAWVEQSKQIRTDGGSLRTEGYQPYRAYSMALDTLSATERTTIANMFRKLGLRNDFFVSFFPEDGTDLERDYTAAVKMTSSSNITADHFDNFSVQSIQLEEV